MGNCILLITANILLLAIGALGLDARRQVQTLRENLLPYTRKEFRSAPVNRSGNYLLRAMRRNLQKQVGE